MEIGKARATIFSVCFLSVCVMTAITLLMLSGR